jgi:hypothetical protein
MNEGYGGIQYTNVISVDYLGVVLVYRLSGKGNPGERHDAARSHINYTGVVNVPVCQRRITSGA